MWAGRGVRQQRNALAVSRKRGVAISNGFEVAAAICAYLAERQFFSIAREICGLCAVVAGRGRAFQTLTVTGRNRPAMADAKLRAASCSQEAEQLQL